MDVDRGTSVDVGRGAPIELHRRIDTGRANGNQSRKLQLTSQPQCKTGNVMFHYHIKTHTLHFTTKITLYIPTTTFCVEFHPERDQTKPHLVWHDTLAPT